MIIHAMTPPNNAQSTINEGDILLASQAIKLGQIPSIRQAALVYQVPNSTLRRRMNRTRSKRDSDTGKQRLTLSEEDVLVRKVLELDLQGIPVRCHRRAVAPLRSQQIRSRDRVFPRWTLPQALRMFLDPWVEKDYRSAEASADS
jgi:hypothetical protein